MEQIFKTEFIAEFKKFPRLLKYLDDGKFAISQFITEERAKLLRKYDHALAAMKVSDRHLRDISDQIDVLYLIKNKLLSQPRSNFGPRQVSIWNRQASPPLRDGVDGDFVYGTVYAEFLQTLGTLRLIGRFHNLHDSKLFSTKVFEIGKPVRKNKQLLIEFFDGKEKLKTLQDELTSANNAHRANCTTVAHYHEMLSK